MIMNLGEIRFLKAYEKANKTNVESTGWKELAEKTGLLIIFDKKEIWKDFTIDEAIKKIEEINEYYKNLL